MPSCRFLTNCAHELAHIDISANRSLKNHDSDKTAMADTPHCVAGKGGMRTAP
jgi:hypothetical protein